jgi:hypothetical protein
MEPKARKARLTLLKSRAEARVRPTWAKRSIGLEDRFLGYIIIPKKFARGRFASRLRIAL